MSYNVHLGVGKFVIHHANIPNKQFKDFLENPQEHVMNLPQFENLEEYPINEFSINGWTWSDCLFKIKQCYADVWTKKHFKIFSVNESKFASGGECCLALVADDMDSLLEFIKDYNIKDYTIEENEPIEQWM